MTRRGSVSLVVSLFSLICLSIPAVAAELPARKPGLWEIKTNTGNPNIPQMSIRECVDAATDKLMQENAGSPNPNRQCSKRDIQKSGDTITIDSTCTIAGRTSDGHVVIAGDFQSTYTMTVTNQSQGAPSGRTMTMVATWVGPCTAGQRPGDTIMSNGMKFNILDAGKGMAPGMSPGMAPPAGH
jgi:hypothetical protein